MAQQYDLIVIGSGPGGYVGAIRAAQLGLKTAIVEKESTYGGTCLNVGCIPSKALLESSERFSAAQHEAASHGIKLGSIELDLKTMMERKDKVVKGSTSGVSFLFKKNKIDPYQGLGTITAANEVQVKKADGTTETLHAKNIMIATGSIPNELPFLKFNGKTIISSTEGLMLPNVPKKLVVVGGGVIGLELGSVWLRLGADVTVVEFTNKIGGSTDTKIAAELQKLLGRQGMKFILSAKVTGATTGANGLQKVDYELVSDGSKASIDADVILVATGRRPFTTGLGLEKVGIAVDRGMVVVNDHFQTSTPNIYAIGDVIRGPMLAHKAEEEGVAVAEIIGGQSGHVNYETVPSVIYTWPEVASVGLSEEQAAEKGIAVKIGTFPFIANGRARAMGAKDGLVKILADAKTDRIVGAHIIGPYASEAIAEIVIAMEFGGSAEDIARSFHSHPSLSEAIREAALDVSKSARQM